MSNQSHKDCDGQGCPRCHFWGYVLTCERCGGRGHAVINGQALMCPQCFGQGSRAPAGVRPERRPSANLHKANCPTYFDAIGVAMRALESAGLDKAARRMLDQIEESGGYDNAESIVRAYVLPI